MMKLSDHTFKLSSQTEEAFQAERKTLAKKILDRAISASSNYDSTQELIDAFINDCRQYNDDDPTNGWKNFLIDKCGIDLSNADTGAITGSDANVTINGLTIGTGLTKIKKNVVPEYANFYKAETTSPQLINTGNNGWIILTTAGNDSIKSGGEDSINAGAGCNFITLKGSRSTVDVANGFNSIFIAKNVNSVTLLNYDESKVTLSGNTDAAHISEDFVQRIASASATSTTATNAANIKVIGTDNYFNTDGVTQYGGSDVIKVNLAKAINPSKPSPAGAFIVLGSETNARFVSTNAIAKRGQLVGQVASVYPNLVSFTFKGLTLNVIDRRLVDGQNTTILKTFSTFDDVGADSSDSDTGNAYEKYIVASIYKWWMKESLNLNYQSYGYSFDDSDATPRVINLHFDKVVRGSSNSTMFYHSHSHDGKASTLDIFFNKDAYKKLTDYNDVNGGAKSAFVYLDRTLAHEFTHALMAAKVDYYICLPKFIKEGIAELTHGIKDKRRFGIKFLAKNVDKLKTFLNLEKENTTKKYFYAAGYMLLRYFAKQTALDMSYYVGKIEQNLNVDDRSWILPVYALENTTNAGTSDDYFALSGRNNLVDLSGQ